MKAMMLAQMFATRGIASEAPLQAAWTKFLALLRNLRKPYMKACNMCWQYFESMFKTSSSFVLDSSVSG
jgi:hypothetical protein